MKMILCCKDCTERYLACHDHCDRYKQEKAKHDEYKEKINDYNEKTHKAYGKRNRKFYECRGTAKKEGLIK